MNSIDFFHPRFSRALLQRHPQKNALSRIVSSAGEIDLE